MISDLLASNRAWAAAKNRDEPDFFPRLAQQQAPEALWIGCSDSRVPANEIVGRDPGELFVHRNVANLALPTDLNMLCVLAYAVDVLKVRHVIVCGHYGCGGVMAAADGCRHGLLDHWLEPIREVHRENESALSAINSEVGRVNHLCELNVVRQVGNVARTPIVRDAWTRGQPLSLHGWIYGLSDGLVRDLGVTVSQP
ncbi:carbonic anhydrase [Lutibaculum baratangense]|uniref:Carbonic anhydrase 2 n=1 Tax=Lutibaculum baratangense AMV1 TaxID=631454 RepID=V4RKB0_9HYPH|nr:carbonic anhydrase [Lutibaculum baratangense]ESR25764.1 Carbonic anhydrase [Lutibaculum baratangense AMV1]